MCSRHAKRYWLPAAPEFHYHYNAIAPWKVDAAGKVTNFYAASA